MKLIKRDDNDLGIWGWLAGGRFWVERYTYICHRLTGLAILFYFLLHIVVTGLRAYGIYMWSGRGFLHSSFFEVGEYLVFAVFAYHACNGIRLVLVKLVGGSIESVDPYKTSPSVQRPLLIGMMILTAVLLAIGAYGAAIEELAE